MIEMLNNRTHTKKYFDIGNGEIRLNAHIGHIHYFDKLDSNRFREIDFTLSFDKEKRGWYFNYHSFRPFLPEYADDWVEFRDLFDDKDQTISYKAVCEHVIGRLVKSEEIGIKETLANCIIYDDAFGKGIDYILYFTRSSLKKVVRIRDGFKQSNDMTFDFEVKFPKGVDNVPLEIIRVYSKSELTSERPIVKGNKINSAYLLDITKSKVFDTSKQTLIGNEHGDGKEWCTYLKSFKCWDEKTTASINVDFIVDGNTTILRKIVPQSFLDSSVGDVFTDTTTSYYAGAGDGGMWNSDATWSTVRGATSGTPVEGTSYGYIAAYLNGGSYNIRRLFIPVDTSGVPDTASISAVSLWLCNFYAGDNAGTIAVIRTTQASPTSLTADDFSALTLNTPDEAVTRYDPYASGWTRYTYHEFPFNATGRGWINKTGYTLLGCRMGTYDIDNSAPASGANYHLIYMSEQTGSEPYLSITYSSGAQTPTSNMFLLF